MSPLTFSQRRAGGHLVAENVTFLIVHARGAKIIRRPRIVACNIAQLAVKHHVALAIH